MPTYLLPIYHPVNLLFEMFSLIVMKDCLEDELFDSILHL